MVRLLSRMLGGVALLAAATGQAAPTSESGPIVVGEVAPLSGSEAHYGQSIDHGIQLAFEQLNAHGGVHGRPVSLKAEDDQSQVDLAAKAAKALINDEHVVALLGDVTSALSLAVVPIAQESQIPVITPSATSMNITKTGDYVFQTCFTDRFQGQAMARFAKETLKLSKLAVFRDAASEYSTGLADVFLEAFKAAGGQIVDDETYHKGDLDFRAKLQKTKAAAPQAIFLPGYDNDVAFIARQAREIGIPASVPLLGGDGWDSAELMDVGDAALDGSYFSNHFSADEKSSGVQAFVKAYQKRFGVKPDAPAAMGYDAARILVSAMERTANLSGATLRDAIAATKDFAGVTGNISISGEGTSAAPVVIVKVTHRKYAFVTRVKP